MEALISQPALIRDTLYGSIDKLTMRDTLYGSFDKSKTHSVEIC